MTITIKTGYSAAFPFEAIWHINGIRYNSVFTTLDELKNYFIGRYGDVRFRKA